MRGVFSLGVIWGGATAVCGVAAGAIAGLFGGGALFIASLSGVVLGAVGMMLGTAFGALLTLGQGHRTLEEITPRRSATVGFLAGGGLAFVGNSVLVLSAGGLPAEMVIPALVLSSSIYGVLTAGLAYGTIAVAKKAPDDTLLRSPPPELPSAQNP